MPAPDAARWRNRLAHDERRACFGPTGTSRTDGVLSGEVRSFAAAIRNQQIRTINGNGNRIRGIRGASATATPEGDYKSTPHCCGDFVDRNYRARKCFAASDFSRYRL